MTAARILRRLVRRFVARVKLLVVNHQVATVEQNLAHYQAAIVEAELRKQDDAKLLTQLAIKRLAIKEGYA